jgi:SRSO17 transposase
VTADLPQALFSKEIIESTTKKRKLSHYWAREPVSMLRKMDFALVAVAICICLESQWIS